MQAATSRATAYARPTHPFRAECVHESTVCGHFPTLWRQSFCQHVVRARFTTADGVDGAARLTTTGPSPLVRVLPPEARVCGRLLHQAAPRTCDRPTRPLCLECVHEPTVC